MAMFTSLIGRKAKDSHPADVPVDDEGPVWHALPELALPGGRVSPEEQALSRPARCPRCGEHGYLDRIDIINRIAYQHCPWCWMKWEVIDGEVKATRPG